MGSWRLLRIDRNVERPKCKSAEATGKGAEQSTFRGETSVDGLLCYPRSRSDFVHLRSSEALFKENIRGLFEDSLIHERRIFQGWRPGLFLAAFRIPGTRVFTLRCSHTTASGGSESQFNRLSPVEGHTIRAALRLLPETKRAGNPNRAVDRPFHTRGSADRRSSRSLVSSRQPGLTLLGLRAAREHTWLPVSIRSSPLFQWGFSAINTLANPSLLSPSS